MSQKETAVPAGKESAPPNKKRLKDRAAGRKERLEKSYRLHVGEEGHLSDLKVGQCAELLALHNDNPALRRRLLDMGLTKGVRIMVKKIAPLGDPVDIQLRGYELCVRKSDLMNIDVRVVDGK